MACKVAVQGLVWVVIATVSGSALVAQAPTPPAPRTVLDYYRLVPAEALFPEGETVDRTSAVVLEDIPNGYLRLGGWEGYGEVALFRKADGGALLGVAQNVCAPACGQVLRFLEWTGAGFQDVTARVFPKVEAAQVRAAWERQRRPGDEDWGEDIPVLWVLPRRGTTITLVVQPELVGREVGLLEVSWNRSTFTGPRPAP